MEDDVSCEYSYIVMDGGLWLWVAMDSYGGYCRAVGNYLWI